MKGEKTGQENWWALILDFFLNYLLFCMSVLAVCMYACTLGSDGDQKIASDLPENEVSVISHHVGAGI